MVAIKGHFDGKVIVPDEPVDLRMDQQVLIHVLPDLEQKTDFRAWLGLGTRIPQNPSPRFKSDDDLWE
jgi:hypothetical protein